MNRVLVVGGNGFIGKNIVEALLEQKYDVAIYDMIGNSTLGVETYVGKILDDEEFGKILSNFDTIIYLVSAIMPKQSMDFPQSSYETDIPLLVYTLEKCRENGIKKVIYSSSGGTIYGDNKKANKENDTTSPINHYGICKLTCEKILLLYNNLYHMDNIILRVSNPYGKYQRIESGVGVINTLTVEYLKGSSLKIWGDGENIRDFIDVSDVASAFVKAIELQSNVNFIPIFNVGSGVPISVNDIVSLISDELGGTAEVVYLPSRKFDVKCNYLDISKTKKYLGIVSDVDVKVKIRNYIKYVRDNFTEEN